MVKAKQTVQKKKTTGKNDDERKWSVLCHLAGFVGFIFPFGNIVGPLVVWLYKKDEYAGVDTNGKEALNFQISMLIYYLIAGISFILLIGFILLPAVMVFHVVCMIIASLKTSEGKEFKYPLTMRFL